MINMKTKSAFLLPLLLTSTQSALITPKKLCRDCKFFIPDGNECSKFGETNLVTGRNDYMYASTARLFDKNCGPDARYFEENENKLFTVPYYFVKKEWLYLILASLYITYFYYFIKFIT